MIITRRPAVYPELALVFDISACWRRERVFTCVTVVSLCANDNPFVCPRAFLWASSIDRTTTCCCRQCGLNCLGSVMWLQSVCLCLCDFVCYFDTLPVADLVEGRPGSTECTQFQNVWKIEGNVGKTKNAAPNFQTRGPVWYRFGTKALALPSFFHFLLFTDALLWVSWKLKGKTLLFRMWGPDICEAVFSGTVWMLINLAMQNYSAPAENPILQWCGPLSYDIFSPCTLSVHHSRNSICFHSWFKTYLFYKSFPP